MKKHPKKSPSGTSIPRYINIKCVITAVILLVCSFSARAIVPDPYTLSISTNLTNMYGGGVTIAGCTLAQLEAATLASITTDAGGYSNATSYVNAALAPRGDQTTIAPALAGYLASGQPLLVASLIGAGAIQAVPTVSGSITTAILNLGAISNTVTFAALLERGVTNNSVAVGQIAQAIAASYPVITNSNNYSTDPRINLALRMMSASPSSAAVIVQQIAQTMNINYTNNPPTLPSYDQREQLAQFAYYLSQRVPATVASQVAIGLIQANYEMAPRIVNAMLYGNSSIAPGPFVQSVAKVVDPEEAVELATAIAFGPGVQSEGVSGPVTQAGTQPYLNGVQPYLNSSNYLYSAQIATAISGVIVSKESGSQLTADLSALAAVLSNKVASLGSGAAFQNEVASLAFLIASKNPASARQIANTVTQAIKPFYANPSSLVYVTMATRLGSLAGNTSALIQSSIQSGLSGGTFAWGSLNTDETPNTNL